jgi:hypothetical protein
MRLIVEGTSRSARYVCRCMISTIKRGIRYLLIEVEIIPLEKGLQVLWIVFALKIMGTASAQLQEAPG